MSANPMTRAVIILPALDALSRGKGGMIYQTSRRSLSVWYDNKFSVFYDVRFLLVDALLYC
jgi:hypothetical protein